MEFSLRNGYGPVPDFKTEFPSLTSIPSNTSDKQLLSVKLQHLLNSLTAAEEAAVRRITPLLKLYRLTHGNMGVRGNVHCVWVNSTLGKVLPNLPEECKLIVVTRQGADGSRINSLKFEQSKIVEVLKLLKNTAHPAWGDFEISQDNIDKWDASVGNLADLNKHARVVEVDDDGKALAVDDVPVADADLPIPDEGPAPMQNSFVPTETYEAVLDLDGTNKAQADNAYQLQLALRDLVTGGRKKSSSNVDTSPQSLQLQQKQGT